MARISALVGLGLAAAIGTIASDSLARDAGQGAARHWVAAWGTSQQGAGQATLSNATVRLIARVTVPGDRVRIRLDNTFGKAPLEIGKAMLAPRARGAAVAAGLSLPVMFKGKTSITVPAGESVESDPIALTVVAQQDLAVSLFVNGNDVTPSQHNNAVVTSYVTDDGAGDQTGSEDGKAFGKTLTSMPWLKAIDVRAAAPASAVVAFGDSITDGTCTTMDAHDRWEDIVAQRIAVQETPRRAIVNEGIGGNTVVNSMNYNPPANSPPGVDRLDRDVLSHPGVTHVVVFMGTNDIARGSAAEPVERGLADIIKRIRAKGIKVIGATIIPRQNAAWDGPREQAKNEVNAWIRTKAGFDAVLDFDRVVRQSDHPNLIQAAYGCGDGVHPNPIGYFRMGRSVNLAVFSK
jgi:lysophospholipase L1-like esterase